MTSERYDMILGLRRMPTVSRFLNEIHVLGMVFWLTSQSQQSVIWNDGTLSAWEDSSP